MVDLCVSFLFVAPTNRAGGKWLPREVMSGVVGSGMDQTEVLAQRGESRGNRRGKCKLL